MISYKKILLQWIPVILIWLVSGEVQVNAQGTATLQGIVTDHSNGQPLQNANVFLQSITDKNNTAGAAADGDGFYNISSIGTGTYAVRISFIGYRIYRDTLNFEAGVGRTLNVTLRPDDAQLDEVIVQQKAGTVWKEEGRQRITPVELGRVPSPAGGDLATYLQTLPGVVTMGDRGGQVFIRGGTSSQNLALVDGAIIYRPMHIVGFFSPFPENLIEGVDFYVGGFGPRYNTRISSVMDIEMRHGDRFNTTGSASVSPFVAEIFAEGPIIEGKSSWVLSARNSLIEQTSGLLPIERQPLKFSSQLLKTSLIDESSRCSAMIMNTYDRGRMDFEVDDNIQWDNLVVGGRCVALPEGSRTLMETNVNFSHFSNSRIDPESSGFSSHIWRVNLDLNLRQYVGDIRFHYGFFGRLKRLGFNMDEEFLGLSHENFSQFIGGGHFEASLPIGDRLSIQPGVALSAFPGEFPITVEPRFRFTLEPFGRESEQVTGSAGFYRQSVVGISDMRDAGSIFVAWMNPPIDAAQVEAIHLMLGWQQQLGTNFTWSLEGYYKRLHNQPVPVWNTIARFTTDLALANGDVYGSDLRLEYTKGKFYGMLGYGYSWTLYESAQDHFSIWFDEPIQEFHPPHDRRHQLNALFSLNLNQYRTSVRWQLGSGVPFTRPMGFDDLLDFRERLPDVRRDQGIQRVILDKPYQGRLPVVHRLDVSLERTFRFKGSGAELNIEAGAVNSYNQTNLFYFDVYTQKRIDQLPIVPYLSMTLELGQ